MIFHKENAELSHNEGKEYRINECIPSALYGDTWETRAEP